MTADKRGPRRKCPICMAHRHGEDRVKHHCVKWKAKDLRAARQAAQRGK